MRTVHFRVIILLLLACFLTSCSTARSKDLTKTVKKYNRALRWKGYMAASTLVSDKIRQKFMGEKITELQDRNIVEYNVLDMAFNEEKDEANVIVLYSQYLNSTGQLVNTQERQEWKHKGGKWKLYSYQSMGRQTSPGVDSID